MTIIRYDRHASKKDAKSFPDIQRLFGNLVPFKSTIGNPAWITMFRDKKTANLYPYYKDIEDAKAVIANGGDPTTRTWSRVQEIELGRPADKEKGEFWPFASDTVKNHRIKIEELESKYCLSVKTYPDVELLKTCYKQDIPAREVFDPNMSVDMIMLKYGCYNYIQIRPGKIVLDRDGNVKHRDPFAFKVKVFYVPANPEYLELMLNRLQDKGN